jgi:uncharacterized protein (TIGR03083 family)
MFAPLHVQLVALLRQLSRPAWLSPTMCGNLTVKDVVSHLLGVELANVSARRDGARLAPAAGQSLATWLDAYNAEWVSACRRLSPRVLVDQLTAAAAAFHEYVQDLDIDRFGEAVSWAGPEPAPVWLDVAREYTERWVHQQQIREAVCRPHLDPTQLAAVLATFVHALPVALAPATAGDGATVTFTATGDGGGAWHLTRRSGVWRLGTGSLTEPTASVSTTADGAWRMFTRHPTAPMPIVAGEAALTTAVRAATAIIR